jgi:hypothetical protein
VNQHDIKIQLKVEEEEGNRSLLFDSFVQPLRDKQQFFFSISVWKATIIDPFGALASGFANSNKSTQLPAF